MFISEFHALIEEKAHECEEGYDEDVSGSLGLSRDEDGENEEHEIFSVDPLPQGEYASIGEEEEGGDEEDIVIDIGEIEREFRLEGEQGGEDETDFR